MAIQRVCDLCKTSTIQYHKFYFASFGYVGESIAEVELCMSCYTAWSKLREQSSHDSGFVLKKRRWPHV